MADTYKNIEEYSPNKKCRILIVVICLAIKKQIQ